ncbi:MAG TPA: hypothetical protein VGH45_03180 [Solirubrobacteraceae bacterium]
MSRRNRGNRGNRRCRRLPRLTGPGRSVFAGLAALAVLGSLAPAAQAGWSRPFEFTAPGSLDLIGAQLAFAPNGSAAAAYGVEDVDTPGDSQAFVTPRSRAGAVGSPKTVASAKQVLALSYDGSALQLLTGAGPSALACCSSVQAVRLSAGGTLQRPQTLVGGLTGRAEAQLLTLSHGGMLAAIATERGVWVVSARRGRRFGAQHRLSTADQIPQSMAATWRGGQSTLVAWTSARGPAGTADPRTIYYAQSSGRAAPRQVHKLLTVASGHRIDELDVARRGSRATAAWVESWYDKKGSFHSIVRAADVAAKPGIRNLSPASQLAAGVSASADASGDQAVSWKLCRGNGSCTVQAALRGAHSTFAGHSSFGQSDPSDAPVSAVGPRGQAIVAWVRSGQPRAAVGSAHSRRFGRARILSENAQFAADLTVAFGPRRQALAAWSQGTLNPSLVGAAYTAP